MNKTIFYRFVFALLPFCMVGKATPAPDNLIKHGNDKLQLKWLGEIHGKTFYIEDNLPMDWFQAYSFCKLFNMTMGSPRSIDERDFLVEALKNVDYSNPGIGGNLFWLSGQEFGGPSWRTSWKENSDNRIVELELEITQGMMWDLEPRSEPRMLCGSISVWISNGVVTDVGPSAWFCEGSGFHKGVICQS